MDLTIVVHVVLMQNCRFSKVLIHIYSPGIAERKRPVFERASERFPNTTGCQLSFTSMDPRVNTYFTI